MFLIVICVNMSGLEVIKNKNLYYSLEAKKHNNKNGKNLF